MKFNLETLQDLTRLTRELAQGLLKLDFLDNFESFETTVTIPSSTTGYQIVNELSFIPSKYIITSQEGNGLITKSASTDWTINYLYLDNNGSADVTLTVIFMR